MTIGKYKQGTCKFPFKAIERLASHIPKENSSVKYKGEQKMIEVNDCIPTAGKNKAHEDYLCATTVKPDKTVSALGFVKVKR